MKAAAMLAAATTAAATVASAAATAAATQPPAFELPMYNSQAYPLFVHSPFTSWWLRGGDPTISDVWHV
eukprot:COSAG02_NODE_43101_length_378_cov_0.698925_1_plen_68_part_10